MIRDYNSSDCEEIVKLFYDTVHNINKEDYTQEQLNAWVPKEEDLEKWDRSFLEHVTVVAVLDGKIVGFGDVDQTGYLDRLYVHKDYQRQGIANELCEELEDRTESDKFTVCASITAKPFFEKRGYKLVKEQQVKKNGVDFLNYVMEKEDTTRMYLGIGICLGAGIGGIIGQILFDNYVMGMSIGIGFGMLFGVMMDNMWEGKKK